MRKRKDGRWEDRFTVNGHRVSVYGKTKGECQANVRRWMEDNNRRRRELHLFGTVMDEFYREWEVGKSRNSIASRHALFERMTKFLGNEPIEDIDAERISRFYEQIVADGVKGVKSISMYTVFLCAVMKYAVRSGYIKSNPCRDAKKPKAEAAKERYVPTEEEEKKIRSAFAESGIGLFMAVLYYTGVRPGEALALRYDDIYDGVVHVRRSIEGKTKTEAGVRDIPLLPQLEKLIGDRIGREEYIFHQESGKPYYLMHFQADFMEIRDKLGLNKDFTFYCFRHCFCTILYEAGVDAKTASAIMGHADIKITQEIYTHLRENHRVEEFDKVKKMMGSRMGSE